MLPLPLREAAEQALEHEGTPARIVEATPVSGGCINEGHRLELSDGRLYFLKQNRSAPRGMFAAEADGLEALRAAAEIVDGTFRPVIPRPIAWADPGPHAGWLLMEWVAPGPAGSPVDERLGRGLALMHGQPRPGFGWSADNWIGSLPQSNRPKSSWAAFWRDERILPQLETARRSGYAREVLFDRLVEAIDSALDDVDTPALLHGDLWSGNAYAASDGRAVLIDPAVYQGDAEVDLAMTELFGGFGSSFYEAYDEVRAISDAYRSHRRALYQLYYLLVHVNLFGAGYLSASRAAAETVLAAVR